MPAPALTFALEFATDKAKAALQALVPDVVGIVQNVLAPISPSNLVTQIAQQGLGINSLSGNLVNGGVGALGQSRFGYLVDSAQRYNAEGSAFNQTVSDAQAMGRAFGRPSDDMLESLYNVNMAGAKSDESIARRMKESKGQAIAMNDTMQMMQDGTKLYGQAQSAKAWLSQNMFPEASRETSTIPKVFAAGIDIMNWINR